MGARRDNKSPTEPTQNSHSARQKQNTNNTADLMIIIAARKPPLQKSERGAETKEEREAQGLRGGEGPGGRAEELRRTRRGQTGRLAFKYVPNTNQ